MIPQPIYFPYSTNKTCWFMSIRPSDKKVLNKDSLAYEVFAAANLAHYAIAYTEIADGSAGTGVYVGLYPDGFEYSELPIEASYQQAGAQPALPDDLPIASLGNSQGANVAAIANSVVSPSNLRANLDAMEAATVQSGSNTTTQVATNLTGAVDNLYNGRVVIFTSGSGARSAGIITGYVASTHALSFTAVATAPAPGDTLLVA